MADSSTPSRSTFLLFAQHAQTSFSSLNTPTPPRRRPGTSFFPLNTFAQHAQTPRATGPGTSFSSCKHVAKALCFSARTLLLFMQYAQTPPPLHAICPDTSSSSCNMPRHLLLFIQYAQTPPPLRATLPDTFSSSRNMPRLLLLLAQHVLLFGQRTQTLSPSNTPRHHHLFV
ncbi:hypothetical protein TNCT_442221 [Trichonephila clavata]|uniref:Uncharacterized protein n=1 Tax=Trichonephila clavata TaxID=2740835 RepID=A0A8X6G9D5_TRICU|nr:hypothetical protein TNCT_442221 [Trichonephila clavata]